MKTILIVDDQEGICLLLEETFKREGYKAISASNGEQALHLLQEMAVDCVLLDMKMPGLTGLDVLKKMKRDFPHIPVIMMTAYEESPLVQECLKLGAKKYVVKPFDIFDLRNIVENLFIL